MPRVFSLSSDANDTPDKAVDDTQWPWTVPLSTPGSVNGFSKVGAVKTFQIPNDPTIGFEIFLSFAKNPFSFTKGRNPDGTTNITIVGERSGRAYLRARRILRGQDGEQEFDKAVLDNLDVWVQEDRPLKISILNITGPKQERHTRIFSQDECEKIVNEANKILQPQCGVVLELKTSGFLIVPGVTGETAVSDWNVPVGPLPKPLKYYKWSTDDLGQPIQCVQGVNPNPLGCDPGDPSLVLVDDPRMEKIYREWNFESYLKRQPHTADVDVYVVGQQVTTMGRKGFHAGGWNIGDRKIIYIHAPPFSSLLINFGEWFWRTKLDTGSFEERQIRTPNRRVVTMHCRTI